ncbi:hypothetical protein [Sporisorium scitamineum]|uniref:Uncharacterized protein n=1 Tax=Sporisorium scitamineum TaxID=49012 RepID=A0A0F7SA98_9BASI|nr:hypothetical protein [Sporisorium scitamineum]
MWYNNYAVLLLPASKTDPFRLGTPLVIPKVGGISNKETGVAKDLDNSEDKGTGQTS